MNINLNIPIALVERIATALERLALATERIAGPIIEPTQPQPFSPDYWGTSSTAQSLQTEEEDRWAAKGYDAEYQQRFVSALSDANRIRNSADANRQGPPKDSGQFGHRG